MNRVRLLTALLLVLAVVAQSGAQNEAHEKPRRGAMPQGEARACRSTLDVNSPSAWPA